MRIYVIFTGNHLHSIFKWGIICSRIAKSFIILWFLSSSQLLLTLGSVHSSNMCLSHIIYDIKIIIFSSIFFLATWGALLANSYATFYNLQSQTQFPCKLQFKMGFSLALTYICKYFAWDAKIRGEICCQCHCLRYCSYYKIKVYHLL